MENRRQAKRYNAAVAAEIQIHGETCEGETHDISAGGVSAAFPAAVGDGEVIALTLILTQDGIEDPTEEPFDVQATVMWSAPTDSGQTMLGLRFVELGGDEQIQLKRFLTALEK